VVVVSTDDPSGVIPGSWNNAMKSVEAATAEREFLCGGRFTIADICVAYAIHLAMSLEIKEVLTPNIARYWERINELPSYQRIKEK